MSSQSDNESITAKKQPKKNSTARVTALEPSRIFAKHVGQLKARPQENPSLALGVYSAEKPAKGFSIALTPKPTPGSVVTDIRSSGSANRYELVLHILNQGQTTVTAEVWQL